MNETYLFFDTNLLLHYKFFDQADWPKAVGARRVTAALASVVVRELDRHKDLHQNKRLRKRAGSVIARLDQLLEKGNPSPVRAGLELLLLAHEPDIDFAAYRLKPDVQDDQLIASLLAHRRDHPEARIVLGTADLGLKIKARQHGIEVFAPPADLKLPEEPDPDQEQIKLLQHELRKHKEAAPALTLRFADGSARAEFVLPPDAPVPTKKIGAQVEELRRQHPLRSLPAREPGRPASELFAALAAMSSFSGEPTNREIEQYNADLKAFYGDYRQYLVDKHRHQTRPQRTLELRLALSNGGTRPAEDIDLFLHFPDGFLLYDEESLPDEPEPPDEPAKPKDRRRGMFDFTAPSVYIPPLISSAYPGPRPNVSAPTIKRTNSYDVRWHVGSLKHGMEVDFAPLLAVYETAAGASPFTVEYRINAANVPEEVSGQLHVIIGPTV